MIEIEKSLRKFVSTCKKHAIFGSFGAIDDLDNLFPANLLHSTEMDYFYKKYNPEKLKIETGFTPIKIYSVTELAKAQSGYTYFPVNYIVIGDDYGGGKPIIAIVDGKLTTIYANYDVGVPLKIADSFSSFILSLTELIDLVYGDYNIFDIADDNDEVNKDFIAELKKRIVPLIGTENFIAFYDYFYG